MLLGEFALHGSCVEYFLDGCVQYSGMMSVGRHFKDDLELFGLI